MNLEPPLLVKPLGPSPTRQRAECAAILQEKEAVKERLVYCAHLNVIDKKIKEASERCHGRARPPESVPRRTRHEDLPGVSVRCQTNLRSLPRLTHQNTVLPVCVARGRATATPVGLGHARCRQATVAHNRNKNSTLIHRYIDSIYSKNAQVRLKNQAIIKLQS